MLLNAVSLLPRSSWKHIFIYVCWIAVRTQGKHSRRGHSVLQVDLKCGSVDTLDCTPPPALPPRRPPWPPNNLSPATLRSLGAAVAGSSSISSSLSSSTSSSSSSSSSLNSLTSGTNNISLTNFSNPILNTRQTTTTHHRISQQNPTSIQHIQRTPQPPILVPPQYPAPPRPPSRNGGDEARVARAGSGRGETSFANGIPSSRGLPPRAGWAVRQPEKSSSPVLLELSSSSTSGLSPGFIGISKGKIEESEDNRNQQHNNQITRSNSGSISLGQWSSDCRSGRLRGIDKSPGSSSVSSNPGIIENPSLSSPPVSPASISGATSALTAGTLLRHELRSQKPHQIQHQSNDQSNNLLVDRGSANNRWPERLELRGVVVPMSQNVSPPLRPPSSASSSVGRASKIANNIPRVHCSNNNSSSSGSSSSNSAVGHDHTRPLPPPRLLDSSIPSITTISSSSISSLINGPPLTAPLTPLSSTLGGSFRSNTTRTTPINAIDAATSTTITNNNNNINNNNNNNNNTTSQNVQQNNSDSVVNIAVRGGSNQNSPTINRALSNITDSSSRSTLGEVTLTVPRPDGERAVNEYVETPFRQTNTIVGNQLNSNLVTTNQKCLKNERRFHHHHHHHHHLQQQQQQQQQQHPQQQQQNQQIANQAKSTAQAALVSTAQARNNQLDNNSTSIRRNQSHLVQSSLSSSLSPVVGTITKQPVSFTKEPSNVLGSGGSLGGGIGGRLNDPSLSIMCDYCGRCRCESCREPPPLPSRWLCDNSCFCSAETALDYASCLCCVKGVFYHCADSGSGTDSEAGGNCADEPCSCTGPRKTARWACLGALTLVLPCLLCYWPLKGCVAMCENCYARHATQGCRCDPNTHGRHHNTNTNNVVTRDSRDPEKRLLDPVTPEL